MAEGVFKIVQTCSVGSALLPVTAWSYSAPEGGAESLDVTVQGDASASASSSLSVTVTATDVFTGQVWSRTFGPVPGSGEYAVDNQSGLITTRLRAVDPTLTNADRSSSPEVIPWVQDRNAREAAGLEPDSRPDGVSCAAWNSRPQNKMNVNDVVNTVTTQTGTPLQLNAPGFSGESFLENAREYSTAGKSSLQVLRDLFGPLNYEFFGEGGLIHVFAPQQSLGTATPPPDRYVTTLGREYQKGQYPSSIISSGADQVVQVIDLLNAVQNPLDPGSNSFERNPTGISITGSDSGNNVTQRAVRKFEGRVVEDGEVKLGRVEARTVRDVNGVQTELVKVFSRAGLSKSNTQYRYATKCADQLIQTIKSVTTYAYAYDTETHIDSVAILPSWFYGFYSGDALEAETTTTNQTWSPEGWLASRQTIVDRIATVQQVNASTPTPGAISAKSRTTVITNESWRPVGGGQWLYRRTITANELVPVWDESFKEYVKLEQRVSEPEDSVDITDQGPPSSKCKEDCDGNTTRVPQSVTVALGGGGAQTSISMPWVASAGNLGGYANTHALELKPKTIRQVASSLPWSARRRHATSYGLVRSVTASGGAGQFVMTVSCETYDA